jgi:hypothetical protein
VQALKASAREKIFEEVTGELCREIDTIAPNFVQIATVPNFIDVRFFIWNGYGGHISFTYTIDLERSLDEIWASFSGSCRRKIKRARAHSPEIQQTHDVTPLLDIWKGRFSELGVKVPLLSDSYLKELVATFPEDVTVYTLSIDGRLATAAACVLQKERYFYWIGGVNAHKDLSVQEYLIWEGIQRAKSEGFKKLDLGESDARISRYKVKFDPVLEPFCYVERVDRLCKTVGFAFEKLSRARKLVSDALPRAHP